jgi:alpha-glucoside transport system substrate-binding protein
MKSKVLHKWVSIPVTVLLIFTIFTNFTALAQPTNYSEGFHHIFAVDKGAYHDQPIYIPIVTRNFTDQPIKVLVSGQDQATQLEETTKSYEVKTGIDIQYEGVEDFSETLNERLQSGNAPDLALFPNPGWLRDLVPLGYTIDLNNWFAPSYLQWQYDQSWLDMATMDGEMAGVWYKASIKSLVWYPKAAFEASGYITPTTWTEMINLTDQIVADGRTPWCIGNNSGPASGWPGTDWVEDIILRTVSPQDYDRWTQGEIQFASSEVHDAWQLMGDIWLTDEYVYGGTSAINTTSFSDAIDPLFETPPGCWLHRQANFIPIFFPDDAVIGVNVDYFQLPSIDPQYGNPVLIAGDIYSAFNDSPEIRNFVTYLTTGESVRMLVESGDVTSPHRDTSLDWYPTKVERGYARILMNADTIRFDGSDIMPTAVGAGTFWRGIVDYVYGVDLDTILAYIDASWP